MKPRSFMRYDIVFFILTFLFGDLFSPPLSFVMDPKYSGDVLRHLEKQKELLMDAYRSMSHELHKLQVEEEMVMRKYFEFMASQDLIVKKNVSTGVKEDVESSQSREEDS